MISRHRYHVEEPGCPTLGLIVLSVDETIEGDMARLFRPAQSRLHVTRVPSGATLTPSSIAQMEAHLPTAARLLPAAAEFASIGYACTSGAALIGPDRVRSLIAEICQCNAITNPLTATCAAVAALGITRLGIVSPYIASVAEPLVAALAARGVHVGKTISFGEEVEARVARIAPASTEAAARDLAADSRIDGLFLSCTNLRSLEIIEPLEAELGIPVLSSNQVLAWHMSCLAKVHHDGMSGIGRLWQH